MEAEEITEEAVHAQIAANLNAPLEEIAIPPPVPDDLAQRQETPERPRGYRLCSRYDTWMATDDMTQSRLHKNLSANLLFHRDTEITPVVLIAALEEQGYTSLHIKALQRASQPGVYTVTFKEAETKERFLQSTTFHVAGQRPLLQDTRFHITFVSIRHAPPELPDAAVIARLKCYGEVISFRRAKHYGTEIENGVRTARMRLHSPIPSYIRIASESLLILYQNQPRTCRRCNRTGHEARNCNSYACYNCDEIGHVASACQEPTRCSICKNISHKAYACPYAVIDELDVNLPISTVLADALAAIPVIPTAENSAADELTDAESLQAEQSSEPAVLAPSKISPPLSGASANTIVSTPTNIVNDETIISTDRDPAIDSTSVVSSPPFAFLPTSLSRPSDDDARSITSSASKRDKPEDSDSSSSDGDDATVMFTRRRTIPVKPYSGKPKNPKKQNGKKKKK